MRRVPDGYPHGPAAALAAGAALEALEALDEPRAIILVEGVSDQIAVDALARRLGIDVERTATLPVGGAQGLRRMLHTIVARFPDARLGGLYDIAEADVVRRALEDSGLLQHGGRPQDAGFFACAADLEDELLRACGPALVEECLAVNADLTAFRRLQQQQEWRGRPFDEQARRWIASGARRKLRYARILVDAAPLERMPHPLVAALEWARQT
ncbi:TOPRIM nucleotidyl transferase/hydrolase domain-containing protein [Microbacterium deminutum]|uniref:OLD protein-like TOPRIM domain-containing protein n=1 Tax=Microbacterium deminutum TaxID=344164 RepID=A0ABN2RFK3_9MICO